MIWQAFDSLIFALERRWMRMKPNFFTALAVVFLCLLVVVVLLELTRSTP